MSIQIVSNLPDLKKISTKKFSLETGKSLANHFSTLGCMYLNLTFAIYGKGMQKKSSVR